MHPGVLFWIEHVAVIVVADYLAVVKITKPIQVENRDLFESKCVLRRRAEVSESNLTVGSVCLDRFRLGLLLPRPSVVDLNNYRPAEESPDQNEQSENRDAFEGWVKRYGSHDIRRDEDLQPDEQRASKVFSILPIAARGMP
jgi:hypothetical protein